MSEFSPQPAAASDTGQPRQRFTFSLRWLMFIFTVTILIAASCGGLVRMDSIGAQDAKMLIFALPLGGMIGASVLRALLKWMDSRSG